MTGGLLKDWVDYESEDDIVLGAPKGKTLGSGSGGDDDNNGNLSSLISGLNIEPGNDSEDRSSYYSDDDELSLLSSSSSQDSIEPYDMASLPGHACKYCGIHNVGSVARCTCCDRWFCNGKGVGNSGTHIVQHLVRAKHREVALHPESAVGDAVLECYHCGNRNIFLLGFIPAKADTVVVLLCRQPCASGAAKDASWDLENWMPLVNQRALLSWLVGTPPEREVLCSRPISSEQIVRLEELWKTRPEADLPDLDLAAAPEEALARVQLHYESALEYHSIMAPLVALEAEQDKVAKEAQCQDSVAVRWDIGLNMKRIAWFMLPTSVDSDFRITAGDEVEIKHKASKWKGTGNIIKIPSSLSEEIAVEIQCGGNPPSETTGYSVEFVWKATPYERMTAALKLLARNDGHLDRTILGAILGQDVDTPGFSMASSALGAEQNASTPGASMIKTTLAPGIEQNVSTLGFPVALPKKISAPGLPELNHSQAQAVNHALTRALSLIQGPPGTGKTVTSATIVYHLTQMNNGPILVCAPSNVAVDHLTEKIHQTGLRVVRLAAKWREDVDTAVSFLTLHSQMLNFASSPELQKLGRLKAELGGLSAKDERRYLDLKRKAERQILKAAQVICTTAIGAGDRRLSGFKFSAVLLDEATQAVEPEALIPLVHKPKQAILVGDHRQLGPVVLSKRAVKAGFNQSLFERLITLGLRPVRLQVQYRMHPCLAEFPSNMFYDGSLQNGVTAGERLRRGIDFPWPNAETPMFFLSCIGTEEISSSGTSFLNRVEASNCEKIVTRLLKAAILPSQIGVITPYIGQRAFIEHYMQTSGTLRKELYMEVEVASVDAFQGREKDYIILSCVRSNDTRNIGFLSDARRLNVALTRAKYGLMVLGNPKALSRNLLWQHLISHFQEKGVLV